MKPPQQEKGLVFIHEFVLQGQTQEPGTRDWTKLVFEHKKVKFQHKLKFSFFFRLILRTSTSTPTRT